MSWCFATVNGRLAEIYFNSKKEILGYCYVEQNEYKTKREKQWIKEDMAHCRFSFRKGIYRNQRTGKIAKNAGLTKNKP